MATNEPILTREEFDAIGSLFAERSVDNRERKDTQALLLRVIHCEKCGGRMYLSKPTRKGASVSDFYKCNAHARGDRCDAPASIRADWVDAYVEREFLRQLGGPEITEVRTIPGYDPQPEIDATLAEFEEHQAQRGRQRSKAAQAAWQRRADALDARLAYLESREPVEARTVEISTGETYADKWVASDTAGRRRMLIGAGAYLSVARGTPGGWRRLDESRVSLDVRHPFYAGAANELLALAADVAAERYQP